MRYFASMILLLLFTACSPKYMVKTHYTHPTGPNAKSCLENCETKRSTCQTQCNKQYDQCLINAEINAKDHFGLVMDEYDRELEDYYYQMDQYTLQLRQWESKEHRLQLRQDRYNQRCSKDQKNKKGEEPFSCKQAKEIKNQLRSMFHDKPYEPSQPFKPTLDNEIRKFQDNCSRECQCTDSYDSCFVSCGGKLSYEKICVENCD